jgi:RNA polymerase sigma factor (sigma-70 family)
MTGPAPTGLRGDEAALYREHHTGLYRAVARRVRLDEDLIEDACQTAWMQLLRCQPDRERSLFGWLVTVAVHEAYDLSRRRRGELSLDAPAAGDADGTMRLVDTVEGSTVVDESLEARRALRALASLSQKQRRYAVLRTAGFSYREIGQLTGATHTNVNKHLVRASRQLKSLADQAA